MVIYTPGNNLKVCSLPTLPISTLRKIVRRKPGIWHWVLMSTILPSDKSGTSLYLLQHCLHVLNLITSALLLRPVDEAGHATCVLCIDGGLLHLNAATQNAPAHMHPRLHSRATSHSESAQHASILNT